MSKSRIAKFVFEYCLPTFALCLAGVLPRLPLPVVRFIVLCLFPILYPIAVVLGLRRRFARNIDAALHESLDAGGANRIARKTLYYWLLNVAEMVYFYNPRSYRKVEKYITIEGLEKINRYKKNGMGVIGVTAHYGNFPLMLLRLSLEDIKLSYLYKEMPPPVFGAILVEYMYKVNLKPILTGSLDNPAREAAKDIENSGFVVFVADEFKKNTGVEVVLFGKPTRQAVGPAVLAIKTGAPILPLFIIREKTGRFKAVIEDPIECEFTGDTDKDIVLLTQKRMDVIEKFIRRHPEHWLWIHSRWIKKDGN